MDIQHYNIEAMNYGLTRLEKLPLSLRLVREVHGVLMAGGRASHHVTPGEFRTSQNWLGGTSPGNARFVPPPVHEMTRALGDLEKFLHAEGDALPILKVALAHAQFETIHPFVDGNGRTGRLLITFYLCNRHILERPVLYLSAYFKKHRDLYFDLLNAYHTKGAITPWVNFFFEGIASVAEEAIETSRKVTKLRDLDITKIQSLGRAALEVIGMVVLNNLYRLPIVNVKKIEEWTGLSRVNANALVKKLITVGILSQRDSKIQYARVFHYKKYISLFS